MSQSQMNIPELVMKEDKELPFAECLLQARYCIYEYP